MKEEDRIIKKCGTETPFTVPEGYFDHLTDRIMDQLPEKETSLVTEREITTWQKVRPWLYMAAMFIAILLPIRFMVNQTTPETGNAMSSVTPGEQELLLDEYIDVIMNQSMMDDYALYQYLTEADTDFLYH